MTLFEGYGEPRKRRKPPAKLPMLKLRWPWVLTRHQHNTPIAHLAFRHYNHPHDKTPMINPECNHRIGRTVLKVDGEPLVDVCRACLKYARMNNIFTETREVP